MIKLTRIRICSLFVMLLFSINGFCEKIPTHLRCDYALKMHQGFCLQSLGHSGSAFFSFNEGYQNALASGISSRKLYAIWNLFMWYRKYGHYLGLFETSGDSRIIDAYRGELGTSKKSSSFRSETDKIRDRYEVAEISRELILYTAEVIGGLLGAAFLPTMWKFPSLVLAVEGIRKIALGINRLKTYNDIVGFELKQRAKEIENAASNINEDEWWLK